VIAMPSRPRRLLALLLQGLLALCAATAAVASDAAHRVEIASLPQQDGKPLALTGYWFSAASSAGVQARPAVLLLHGCGGALGRQADQLSERMQSYRALLNQQGWHVLVLDSLSPRGERELCTQRIGSRQVTMRERRRDTLGALHWLAARPEVDPARIALLGWSNGGSTVLASTAADHEEVKANPAKPRAAVAFYPGCEAELKRGYRAQAPLLMLLGGADDWTAAAPCEALAAHSRGQAGGATVQFQTYAGAYHGFDAAAPVRLRREVPNGVNPGAGVHVGGNAEAWAASREAMLGFLREQLK
jgi:dienelactone hydrolase